MLKKLCCMRLRTAGIVIGWLGLVGAAIAAAAFCGLLIYTSVSANDINDPNLPIGNLMVTEKRRLIVTYSCFLAAALLQLLASAMLLLGTLKNRHLMLLPWLINSSISILFVFLSSLRDLYNTFDYSAPAKWFFATALVSDLISLALSIWFFIAIYSLYKEIKAANAQKEIPLNQSTAPEMQANQNSIYSNYAKF